MLSFEKAILSMSPISMEGQTSLQRTSWKVWVEPYLVLLHNLFYEEILEYLEDDILEQIASACAQEGLKLDIYVMYDWRVQSDQVLHASILTCGGTVIALLRHKGTFPIQQWGAGLTLRQVVLSQQLASLVHRFAEVRPKYQLERRAMPRWLWEHQYILAPLFWANPYFYTVVRPLDLEHLESLGSRYVYLVADSMVHEVHRISSLHLHLDSYSAIAHTLQGPRSVDVRQLIYGHIALDAIEDDVYAQMVQRGGHKEFWQIEALYEAPQVVHVIVADHIPGKIAVNRYIATWDTYSAQLPLWRDKVGFLQSGSFDIIQQEFMEFLTCTLIS